MGHMRHDAIIVTDCGNMEEVHEQAKKLFGHLVSEKICSMNCTESFFIAPDGSKEGWKDSNDMDIAREKFSTWLKDHYQSYADVVHISFGGDEPAEVSVKRIK